MESDVMQRVMSCQGKAQKEAQGFIEGEDQNMAFETSRWKCQVSGKIK